MKIEFSDFQDSVITSIMITFGVTQFISYILFFTTKYDRSYFFKPGILIISIIGILLLELFVF